MDSKPARVRANDSLSLCDSRGLPLDRFPQSPPTLESDLVYGRFEPRTRRNHDHPSIEHAFGTRPFVRRRAGIVPSGCLARGLDASQHRNRNS